MVGKNNLNYQMTQVEKKRKERDERYDSQTSSDRFRERREHFETMLEFHNEKLSEVLNDIERAERKLRELEAEETRDKLFNNRVTLSLLRGSLTEDVEEEIDMREVTFDCVIDAYDAPLSTLCGSVVKKIKIICVAQNIQTTLDLIDEVPDLRSRIAEFLTSKRLEKNFSASWILETFSHKKTHTEKMKLYVYINHTYDVGRNKYDE